MTSISDLLLAEVPTGATTVPIFLVTPDTLEAVLNQHQAELGPLARGWIEAQAFTAKPGSNCQIPDAEGRLTAVLFGSGDEPMKDKGPFLFGKLPGVLPQGIYRISNPSTTAESYALAWCLGSYSFDRYISSDREKPSLVVPDGVALHRVEAIAAGVELARDLINTPANDLGPADLSAAARTLADRFGASFHERVGEDLLSENFPMIHAVGRAASPDRAPRLIDFTWGDEAAAKITLVGKGVVFDTGGLDIKPPSAMLLMKKDMGGAGNVLGLASMIMALKVPVRLRVLIPAVENAIAGNAFRPGDVLTSRSGKTVEIGNTDAEGRLVLADALSLACEEAPDLLIDMATLTGAARVAVGPDLVPFYSDDAAFVGDLERHAVEQDDLVWRMPLHPRYRALLDSDIADINHISSGAFAGSITAALFLKEFTQGAKSWAHFDVFGWMPMARPARPKGGEAQAIRALLGVLIERYGSDGKA